jgi:hypothetical protein
VLCCLVSVNCHCYSKVKCILVQALRLCTGRTAHRGSGGIAVPFDDHGTRRGEGTTSRRGRSLPPGKTRYPLYRRLGGPQGRSGQVRKISPPTGIFCLFVKLHLYYSQVKYKRLSVSFLKRHMDCKFGTCIQETLSVQPPIRLQFAFSRVVRQMPG